MLTVNSFPHWVLFLMRAQFPHLAIWDRLRLAGTVAAVVAARKLGLIDHENLKRRLQKLWQASAAGDGGATERAFVERLMRFVRPELSPILTGIAAHEIEAILATAAPGDYAYGLGCALGFAHVLATPPCRCETEPSNVGSRKRDAVLELLADRGWCHRPRIFLTDHADDLPLILVCQTVYWFGSHGDLDAVRTIASGTAVYPGDRASDDILTSIRSRSPVPSPC